MKFNFSNLEPVLGSSDDSVESVTPRRPFGSGGLGTSSLASPVSLASASTGGGGNRQSCLSHFGGKYSTNLWWCDQGWSEAVLHIVGGRVQCGIPFQEVWVGG